MAIGTACLTAAMGVFSGFETSLTRSLQDVFGHLLIVKQGTRIESVEELLKRIQTLAPSVQASSPFLYLDCVLAKEGRISYVAVQGVEAKSVDKVLSLRSHVIAGKYELAGQSGNVDNAMVGKGIARKFNLKPGDHFKVVMPNPSRANSSDFSPKVHEFVVSGVLDLGINDLDEHSIVTDLKTAQDFADVGENFSGLRLKLINPDDASHVASSLQRELGSGYFIRHWREQNENLFEAIEYERPVIFFVLLVMVVAASFNIASNLFVSVLKKYSDMSILRALGFSKRDVMRVFTIQGLFFGIVGTVLGLLLGLVLCGAFVWVQRYWVLMPADVYKLDHVGVRLRMFDIGAVFIASLVISLLSTLVPAYRGSRLSTVEGLRYE
jgi:lipoprotein-releasing system permease protein